VLYDNGENFEKVHKYTLDKIRNEHGVFIYVRETCKISLEIRALQCGKHQEDGHRVTNSLIDSSGARGAVASHHAIEILETNQSNVHIVLIHPLGARLNDGGIWPRRSAQPELLSFR